MTRPNVLVIGPITQSEATVSAIVGVLEKPAHFWAPDMPVPAHNDGRTIVVRDIERLSAAHQAAWLAWLTAQQCGRPHIITTSRIAIFPLVTEGIFLADLYYRLNTILLDLRGSTDQN